MPETLSLAESNYLQMLLAQNAYLLQGSSLVVLVWIRVWLVQN